MTFAKHTPEHFKPKRSAMSLYGKDAHKRVAKCIGYALTVGSDKAWDDLSLILEARLSERERVALAYAALNSLDEETAYLTASVSLFGTLNGEVVL